MSAFFVHLKNNHTKDKFLARKQDFRLFLSTSHFSPPRLICLFDNRLTSKAVATVWPRQHSGQVNDLIAGFTITVFGHAKLALSVEHLVHPDTTLFQICQCHILLLQRIAP